MTGPSDAGDLAHPPRFAPGTRVRAVAEVRNDGTFPGAAMGEILVRPGEVGFVRELGSFLQRYRVYEVDFMTSGRVVGMRAGELEAAEGDAEARP